MTEIIEKDLSYQIVQAAYVVFNELGPGFDENIYENAMVIVLEKRAHVVEQQKRVKIYFQGERLQGSFVLVRMKYGRNGSTPEKPQWLFMKHRDEFAAPDSDIAAETVTSVTTGRTMEEIASGKSKVWQSNRAPKESSVTKRAS